MHRSAAYNGSWVCQPQRHIRNRGVFYGDNPFNFASLILYTQLSLSALLTAFLQLILTPLGESAFISQMLAGIALGPSFLGKDNSFRRTVFPMKSFYVSETFAFFGCLLFMFLVGVKMDLSMVRKSGKRALVIGFCAFFVPLMLNITFAYLLEHKITMEPNLRKSLIFIAAFQSSSSFHVIACLLADLKLLNSELGRLAVSSSMISGICSWICSIITFTARQSSLRKQASFPWMALMSLGAMLIIIIFIFRPIFSWMIGKTAEEKELRESHFFSIFVMILGCALFGEVIGQHFMLGPMVLGLAVPDGPPLGSALVDKLDSYVSSILLPCYFMFSCARINLSLINMKAAGIVEMLALCSLLGKLMGTMLPSLYYDMPVQDSLILGLIMSAQGITDILILQQGMLLLLIDEQSYSIMVISAVVITGTITPMVKLLYKPSRGYMSFRRRRTIQHATPNAELRLLACIYHQDITPSIINLLEVSNPTPKSPIGMYVVHLIQLLGRSSPLLIMHRQGQRNSVHSNQSDHIIKAFQLYEEMINSDTVSVNAFTAIAPYATMHDEICSLAIEKRVSMVIIPFHKQWKPHGAEESADKPVRSVNLKILNNAPCSVGIFVDRGTLSGNIKTMKSRPFYSIVVIFVEGADDREALAYAMRMAEHPDVSLTVIQFLIEAKRKGKNLVSRELDIDMIDQFKMATMHKMRHLYREEVVSESMEVINVIRSLQNLYDLVLLGRRHASNSPLFMGLTMWNEFPELGSLGDMLASSDSNWEVSLLVVQQQTCGGEDMASFKCPMEDSFAVDMSRAAGKVRPVSSPAKSHK